MSILRNLLDNSRAGIECARRKIDTERNLYPRHFLPAWWVSKLVYHVRLQERYICQLEAQLAEADAAKSENSK